MLQRSPVDACTARRVGIPLEELTQERLEAWQLAAFRRTLRHAKSNGDYYAETMADVDPDTLISMEDIRRLPLTSEEDLAGNEWRFQCVSASHVSRIVTVPTTGTQGKAKRLSFSEEDQRRSMEFIYMGFLTMHCREGERMLIMMSGGRPGSIGDAVMKAMEPLHMEIMVHGPVTNIPEAYRRIQEFKPGVIVGIPWQSAALARYGSRFGNPEQDFIRSVLLSADAVPAAVEDRLKTLWKCDVHRHYGMTEMCIFGGVECSAHCGYHLRGCDLLYEIPETDEDGFGEIVITTLDREVMPLIRYRTGDIGRFIDTPCPCGGTLRRIERIKDRKKNLLTAGGAAFFLSEVADAVYRSPEPIDLDCVVSPGGRVELTVKTLPGETADLDRIRADILNIPGIRVAAGTLDISLRTAYMEDFPDGYNLKKKVIYS